MTTGVILALIFTTSCERKISGESIYPIDSLITSQIHYLTEAKASVKKTVHLTDMDDQTTFTPKDTIAWIEELDIFRELKAINKPANRKVYQVEDGIPDERSNLKIKSIVTTEDLPIRSMKIYYQDHAEKVRKIEARFSQKNSLYSSARFLTLEFQDVHNKTVLSSYSIDGGQKMFLADSVTYSINASVSLP